MAPIEVLAAVQYLSTAHWARNFYVSHPGSGGTLHGSGYLAAAILMLLFVIINLVGIRAFARINNAITSWKVAVPVVTILILLIGHFHSANFGHAGGGFFTSHDAIKNILLTLPAGIIFSLLGFEQAVQLGGESANPGRDLPRAVILSILIGAALYILIQVAFIGALTPQPAHLAARLDGPRLDQHQPSGGRAQRGAVLHPGQHRRHLLAGHGAAHRRRRLAGGTGLMYETSSARLSFGLARNGYLPTAFERVNRRKVPVFGVIIATLIGVLFLLPFPSWSKLVGIVTSASVLMYAGAPIALGALRKQKPDLPRPYRLPAAGCSRRWRSSAPAGSSCSRAGRPTPR